MEVLLALAGLVVVAAVVAVALWAIRTASRRAERPEVSQEDAAYLEPIPEDEVPIGPDGMADLTELRGTVEHYAAMYQEALTVGSSPGLSDRVYALAYGRRMTATWGPIARRWEAVPHALELLGHRSPDAREDAKRMLTEVGRDEEVVDAVIAAVEEEERLARDTMALALGRFGSRKAVPALGAIIRDDTDDPDTRWNAAVALGQIVRKRFDREGDAVGNAIRWLDASRE